MKVSTETLAVLRMRLRGVTSREVVEAARPGASRVVAKSTDVAGDVVTDTDYAVQALLADRLPAMLPGSRLVGEEDFSEIADPAEGLIWLVDPLDGTLNFAAGLPFFSSSIALLESGVPVLAMVVDLTTGTVWDAVAGGGACRDGAAIAYDPERGGRGLLSVSSGTVLLDAEHPGLGLLAMLRRTSPRLRILGSQALQLCHAAEGNLRLVVNREAKLWDDAAGWLICREAGAGYALAADEDLFPLVAGSDPVKGRNIFSIAGDPVLVAEVASHIRRSLPA
jgi:myo-inositol-1(or 4)-monophosphatase